MTRPPRNALNVTPGLAISSAPDQATDFLRAPAGTAPVRIGCFTALVLNNLHCDRQDAPITRPNGYFVPRSEDEPAETALSRPGDRHQVDDAGQGAAGQGSLIGIPDPRGDLLGERPLLPRCERPASAWACSQTPSLLTVRWPLRATAKHDSSVRRRDCGEGWSSWCQGLCWLG